MGVLVGLAIGLFVAVMICGIAAFAGICVGVAKESLEEKEEKKEKENAEDKW